MAVLLSKRVASDLVTYDYHISDTLDPWARDARPWVRSSVTDVDDAPFEEIPFCFQFYGANLSSVFLSANGFIALTPTPLCLGFCDGPVPEALHRRSYRPQAGDLDPFPLIGAFVADLDPVSAPQSQIRYHISQGVDGRSLLVEWDSVMVRHKLGQSWATVQVC